MHQPAMTRRDFELWRKAKRIAVYVWPYAVAPCTCGDVNCHGWRLVQRPLPSIAPINAHDSMLVEA
jgi:hypothetical protein